jgi:Leucine-rich repeat (LRR) protein
MRMMLVIGILCAPLALHAHEVVTFDISIIETAYAFDDDTYVELTPSQKTEYAQRFAHALHDGHVKHEEVKKRANKALCHDVSRHYYLQHGSMIDLDAGTVSFPLRTLLQHNRLSRTVNEKGELDLSNLHIADFDGIEEVPNIQSVRSLNLSHNNISLLHPENFKALSHLEHLDLSFNKISSLRPYTFQRLTHLQVLNLSHNHIIHLDRDGFGGLPQLKKLSLACNRIEWLGLDAFDGLSSLKKLDMSNNKLQTIPPGLLKPLAHLKSFKLDHNNFTVMHAHTLYPLHHLEYLDLSNNRITRINGDTLYGLKHLRTINLKNNHLAIVDLAIPHALPNLHTIILGNNPITNQRLAVLQKQVPNAKILKNNPQPSSLHIMPATVQGLPQPSARTNPMQHRIGRLKCADA